MIHTANHTNTFIKAAEDCRAENGIETPFRKRFTCRQKNYYMKRKRIL